MPSIVIEPASEGSSVTYYFAPANDDMRIAEGLTARC
jgi:hypothetical protein